MFNYYCWSPKRGPVFNTQQFNTLYLRFKLNLLFNHLFSATWSNIFEENIFIVSIKSLKGENETRLKNETGITIYHFLTLLQT